VPFVSVWVSEWQNNWMQLQIQFQVSGAIYTLQKNGLMSVDASNNDAVNKFYKFRVYT